eukprot:2610618-Karenia_brevis.AAC.1
MDSPTKNVFHLRHSHDESAANNANKFALGQICPQMPIAGYVVQKSAPNAWQNNSPNVWPETNRRTSRK